MYSLWLVWVDKGWLLSWAPWTIGRLANNKSSLPLINRQRLHGGRFLQLPLIVVWFLTTTIVNDWTLSPLLPPHTEDGTSNIISLHWSSTKEIFFFPSSVPDVISRGWAEEITEEIFLFFEMFRPSRAKMDFCLLLFLNRLFTDCLFCKGLQLICHVAVHVLSAIKRNLLKACGSDLLAFAAPSFLLWEEREVVVVVRQISGDSLALRLVWGCLAPIRMMSVGLGVLN